VVKPKESVTRVLCTEILQMFRAVLPMIVAPLKSGGNQAC
jgi:hypothetical protein